MSSRGSHSRITVAKHVYLRTQQRRLRHVKCIVVRNLTLPETESLEVRGAPLDVRVYFTLHPLYDESKVLYRSDTVAQSYNPSWESVQFSPAIFGKHSSLHIFTIKVWYQLTTNRQPSSPQPVSYTLFPPNPVRVKTEDDSKTAEEPAELAFEGTIDLSDLVYLGTLVNKDGSSYPPNSVVIGMFEGYFSNPAVGGIPPSPPIAHSLVDLLPPRSLLEVNKVDVMDSYINTKLMKILSKQERLNKVTAEVRGSKDRVDNYLKEKEEYFKKKRDVERLKMRVGLLQKQLQQRERLEKEVCEREEEREERLKKMEEDLRQRQATLKEKEGQHLLDQELCRKNKEKLMLTRKSRTLRQSNMIHDLYETFFINKVSDNNFAICKIVLPDTLDQTSSMEQYGVALGYTAHLVSLLGQVLQVPLQYPIKPCGSKSTISDHISEEVVIDTIKEFPLYWKGTEKALFQYAVHLMNKNIGQLRQHCGYAVSRAVAKKTLVNLKLLLDRLIQDYFLSPPPSSAHQSTQRLTWNSMSETMDAASLSSSSRRLFQESDRLPSEDFSSQSSSIATTMTLGGLSPTASPRAASLDHENFHSLVQTPSTPSGRSSFNDYRGGLVMNVSRGRGSDSSNGGTGGSGSVGGGDAGANSSMEDDFQMGFYRARSNHVAGLRRPSSEVQVETSEHSVHEQLHYAIPTTSTAATAEGNGHRLNRTSDSSGSALEADQEKEQWLEVHAEEVENGSRRGPSSTPLEPRSSNPSLTPTPPTSYLDQKYSRIPAGSNCASDAANEDEYMICELNKNAQDSARSASAQADEEEEYATVFSKPPPSVAPAEDYLNNDTVTRCQLYV